MDRELQNRAADIRLMVFDVDGVLTDGRLLYDEQGAELKAFHSRDGFGMKAAPRFGLPLALITGRSSPMVTRRARELNIEHVYQGCDDKLAALADLLSRTGLAPTQLAYAGDDWIDLPVMARVGLAMTVADADPVVREQAHYVTTACGGAAAGREMIALLLQAQGKLSTWLEEYLTE